MLVRAVVATLALIATPVFAAPSIADTHVEASGPSGKSAHRSYRPIAQQSARAVPHTIPAGKISHSATAHNARLAAEQASAARAERLALVTGPTSQD